jgi:hypothetical protein
MTSKECKDNWHKQAGKDRLRTCPTCNALCAWHVKEKDDVEKRTLKA